MCSAAAEASGIISSSEGAGISDLTAADRDQASGGGNARPPVALVPCVDYTTSLSAAVGSLLDHLGGMSAFVRPGETILIKPNMLSDKSPDAAVTTHPALVREIVRRVKAAGGKPVVGDSPASVIKLESVWEHTGMGAMCREEDVPLLNLEREGSVAFAVEGFEFRIAKPVLDADGVINLPKVKTHVFTILTAAVKNLFGTVPGFQKAQMHKLYPTPREFGRLLRTIYDRVPVRLSVADGVVGMEGDGPSAGHAVQLGFLAASADAVALDIVLCGILGIRPVSVPTLEDVPGARSIDAALKGVRVLGAEIDAVKPAAFRVPGTLRGRMIPRWLVRCIGPAVWIRPAFGDACISCGKCVEACPASALEIEKGKRPRLDGAKCIGCCCCHEICPVSAIDMTLSPLLNLVRRGKPI